MEITVASIKYLIDVNIEQHYKWSIIYRTNYCERCKLLIYFTRIILSQNGN